MRLFCCRIKIMKVALYGKGILGKRVYDYLRSEDAIDLICVCTDSAETQDGTLMLFAEDVSHNDSIDAVDTAELGRIYSNGEVDAVILATDNELLDFCIRHLTKQGISKIAIVPSYYEFTPLADDSFIWVETDKPRLPYLEYHVSFHCNLKCAGCSHFSNIVDHERFGDFDSFCNDLIRLQDLFWGIGKIRLMGGEPVLNPQLPSFVYAARGAFPDADIRVVSNGLMLREDHTDLLKAMHDMSVYFDVSMYPPTVNCIDRIAGICKAYDVKLTVTPDVNEFMAGMNLHGNSIPAEAYRDCPASHCTYLCDGRISTCIMPQLIGIYNDRYGLNILPGEEDVIDLYDDKLDGYQLLKKLKTPMDICRYCDSSRRKFDWFVSTDPDKSEWLADISHIVSEE